ncbi:MAG: Holliday junction branch migration protein RuvA [Lachnospiraceae bacterium]|jgi:Holliday junction DNA helicase RuvA|nr:Holliday junction branch migration protein RuvA [Lachnospiraceae bacterium]
MIAYVKGTLEEISENNAVVEVNGMGYNVKISAGTMNRLPRLHQEIKLYTYTAVREDAFWLYGFLTKDELEIFRLLITVNGVGPKGALGILSVMSVSDLRFAILAADGKMLSKAPGIGKKTAERVILDLRDKISMEEAVESGAQAVSATPGAKNNARNEAVEALVALGYGAGDALKAVNQVPDGDEDTETILKAALKHML